MWLPCPYFGADVELTDERAERIEASHPSLVSEFGDHLVATIAEPDFVAQRDGLAKHAFVRSWANVHEGRTSRVVVMPGGVADGKLRYGVVTAYIARFTRTWRPVLETPLTLSYGTAGDILCLSTVPPYGGQGSDEIADGVVARTNPVTGKVEGLEIRFSSSRINIPGALLNLPLRAQMSVPLAG